MVSILKDTFLVDDVVDWFNLNGFEDVCQKSYGMYPDGMSVCTDLKSLFSTLADCRNHSAF